MLKEAGDAQPDAALTELKDIGNLQKFVTAAGFSPLFRVDNMSVLKMFQAIESFVCKVEQQIQHVSACLCYSWTNITFINNLQFKQYRYP